MDIANLRAVFTADTSGLNKGLEQARASLSGFRSEGDKANASCAAFMATEAKLAASGRNQAAVTRQLTQYTRELTGARAKLSELLAGEDRIAANLAGKYANLTNAQRANLAETQRQIQAQERLAAARAKLAAPGTALTAAGGALTAGLTVPILGAGVAAAAAGSDVQGAYNQIRAGTGATGAALEGLEASFRRVGQTVPNSLSAVAGALTELHQRTGLTGTALETLTRQELTLARVTGQDVSPLVEKTTALFENWRIAVRDQGPALDLLFRASQQTTTGVGELAEGMAKAGPRLRALGFGFGDTAALVGNFHKAGLDAGQMTQSLTQILGRMARSGITDAHTALEKFTGLLKNAPSTMDATRIAVQALGLRAGPQFALLVREGRLEFEKTAQAIAHGSDTIAKAGKDTETLATAWAQFKNKAELALAPVGQALLKVGINALQGLTPALAKVKELAEAFSRLSPTAQGALLILAGAGAALGPLLTAFGRFVIAWPGIVAGFEAIKAAVAGLSAATLFTGGLYVVAIAALVAFVAAYTTNFHGLRDNLISGVRVIVGAFEHMGSAIKDFFSGLWEDVAGGLSGLVGRVTATAGALWQRLTGALPQAGMEEGLRRGAMAAQGEVRPHSIFTDFPYNQSPAYQERQNQLAIQRLQQGAAGGGSADITQFLTGKGPGKEKKQKQSDEEKEAERATEKIAANSRIRALLAKGESVEIAKLGGEYMHLTVAQLQNLFASDKLTEAAVKAGESRKEYHKDMLKLNAELRRLKGGHEAAASGVELLTEKYPGLTRAQYQAMNAGEQWKKHLEEVRQKAHAVAEALRGLNQRMLEGMAVNPAQRAAVQLFGEAFEKKYGYIASPSRIWGNLTPAQQAQAAGQGTLTGRAEMETQLGQYKEQGALNFKSRHTQLMRQYFGPDYANQMTAGDIERINQMVKWENVAERVAAATAAWRGEQSKLNQLTGAAEANLEQLGNQWAVLTGKSAAAREVMEQFGVDLSKLGPETQRTVRQFLDLQHTLSFFRELAGGIQGVFEHLFTDLAQKGFKGFFRNVVDSFSQMLQQIAAKYLASQLMNVIIPALGGLFGGGGGGSAITDMSQIVGKASGGDVMGGRPYMVGERGPELIVPRSSGAVVPNAAMAGAAGLTTHIHMTVYAQDANSFRHSHRQIISDLHQASEAERKRRGY